MTAVIDDTGGVTIHGLTHVTTASTPSVPGSSWHVVVRDAAGRLLSDTGVEVTTFEDADGRMLEANVPAAGAASVQVVKDGVVVAERSRSTHRPRAKILSPAPRRAGPRPRVDCTLARERRRRRRAGGVRRLLG